MSRVIKISRKGNVVRFYVGEEETINGHVDITFPFDWEVYGLTYSMLVVERDIDKKSYVFKIGDDIDYIIRKGLEIREEGNFARLI